VKETIEGISH